MRATRPAVICVLLGSMACRTAASPPERTAAALSIAKNPLPVLARSERRGDPPLECAGCAGESCDGAAPPPFRDAPGLDEVERAFTARTSAVWRCLEPDRDCDKSRRLRAETTFTGATGDPTDVRVSGHLTKAEKGCVRAALLGVHVAPFLDDRLDARFDYAFEEPCAPELPGRTEVKSVLDDACGAIADACAAGRHGAADLDLTIRGPTGRIRGLLVSGGLSADEATCAARVFGEAAFPIFRSETLTVLYTCRFPVGSPDRVVRTADRRDRIRRNP